MFGDHASNQVSITISLSNFNEKVAKTKDNEEVAKTEDNEEVAKTKDNEEAAKTKDKVAKKKENEIEISILQQILYCEKAKKLPYSRIPRINTSRIWFYFLFVSFITMAIVTLFIYFSYPFANPNVDQIVNPIVICNIELNLEILVLSFLATMVILFLLLWKGQLHKIKFHNAEIEFDKASDASFSPLNWYIDEIIYFFQKTKCEIVFIEDLDRFDDTQIFSKLRELNTLINNARAIKQKVVFVYAVKEAEFKDETERAKFFDYILSLSPALTPANACDEIIKRRPKLCELKMDFEDDNGFIVSIASFIPDMRVLNNILNDYILTHQALGFTKISGEMEFEKKKQIMDRNRKLFAMMVYKNLDSQGYASLQKRDGEIANIFASMEKYLSKKYEDARKEYEEASQNADLANQLKMDTEVKRYSLKDAYERYKSDVIDELFVKTESDIIRFLLLSGYIAEDYMEFITKEQYAFLSEADTEFIKSVHAKRQMECDHSIKNPENVIIKLPISRFSSEYVLYFDIAKAFISSSITLKDFVDKKGEFFAYLSTDVPKTVDFITKFLTADEPETEKRNFVSKIVETYPRFADMIVKTENEDLKLNVINMLCEICPIHTLKKLNEQNAAITTYINTKQKYLTNAPLCDDKLFTSILTDLNIKLEDCSCSEVNFEKLKLVLQCESYVLNDDNIKFLLVDYLKMNVETVNAATYTSILESGNTEIIKYARENITAILEIVLANTSISEGQEAINEFLLANENEISLDLKKQLIEKQDEANPFDADDSFPSEVLIHALDKFKVASKWESLDICYKSLKTTTNSIHNSLLQFIITKASMLSEDTIDANSELAINIAKNLEDNSFGTLVKSYKGQLTNPDQIVIDSNYAKLIENGNIPLIDPTLKYIVSKKFYESIDTFATLNFEEFEAGIGQYTDKVENIVVRSKSSKVKQFLLNRYYDTHINKPCTEELVTIILDEVKNDFSLSFPMIQEIFSKPYVDLTTKEELFVQFMKDETKANIEKILSDHLPKYNELLKTSMPFTKQKYDLRILQILEDKGLITPEMYKFCTK